MRRIQAIALLFIVAAAASAQVSFSGLDVSDDNQLLFSASATSPRLGSYVTLLSAQIDAEGRPVEQLTVFPEQITYLAQSGRVQIQNRFGLFRSTDGLGDFVPVDGYPRFVDGDPIAEGKLIPIMASPDGRYLVQLEPTGVGYGELVLVEPATGSRTTVARDVEITLSGPRASWSPDSAFFVYEKQGGVYYYSLEQLSNGRLLDEGFRRIGNGTLASVTWAQDSSLYYIQGQLVYRILGVEFFTRSLYADLLRIGTIVGKLPFAFDPSFDTFWIAPDVQKILLNKGGRNLFLLFLRAEDYTDTGQGLGLPSLLLPRNTRVQDVLWSATDKLTVLTSSILSGDRSSSVYRLDLGAAADVYSFTLAETGPIREVVISPDEESVAVLYGDRVSVKSNSAWVELASYTIREPVHAIWVGDAQLLIAGRRLIEVADTQTDQRTVLAIAQADGYGFDDEGQLIVSAEERWFARADSRWTELESATPREPRVASGDYRVYLEAVSAGAYGNVVMIRRATGTGTQPLFVGPRVSYEPFPAEDDELDLDYFTNGSRIRRREVALVFNAIDSVDGLTEILTTLGDYGIRATFFVNGEFIRRHPSAVREIANSGHEVGSLFYVYFDMTDRRYQITEEFIVQGLTRNEDDYYDTTGRELSLLWHAPYYFVSDEIVAAGKAADYTYIGRDVDSLDWVPRRTDSGVSALYMPAAQLIERIVEQKKPGSIISMTVGTPVGGRGDYLFHRLDVLVNALIDRGYEMVPVSTLIERAE